MSKYQSIFTVLVLAALLTFFTPSSAAQEPNSNSRQPAFASGDVLVKFKGGLGVQDTRQKVAGLNVSDVQTIPGVDAARLKVPPGREAEIIAQLQARADVLYAEPNYIAYALDTPNDTFFGFQWGLSKIGLPAGLDITDGNSDITIAVVDTGIDLDHPDLDCLVDGGVSKLTSGWNFVSYNGNPDDDNGHGTHVAGIAAACTDNSTGVSGVAPNVRLMPVKVLDYAGSGYYSDVANGIVYAADNGADIINLSLGGGSSSSLLESAIEYAHNKGVLLVAASGNSGISWLFYPARYPETMAVGATESDDDRAYYSNYGSGLDVVAPGSSIYSTERWGSYGYKSGTSMATPHVAGLAALVWGMNPSLSQDDVREIIRTTAVDLGSSGPDSYYGYGRIDALAALDTFVSITLQQTSGQEIEGPISFIMDDQTSVFPDYTVNIATPIEEPVSWQADLSPEVPWVEIVPAASGQVSAASMAQVTLATSRPSTYGTYTTTLVVNGATTSGVQVGPATSQVKIKYVPQLYRLYFPQMFSN